MQWLLPGVVIWICLLQHPLKATGYKHSHHHASGPTSSSTATRETSHKLIHSSQHNHILNRRSRSFLISSALENIASTMSSNALLSDCITVSISTAFSDLVAQNTEQGQKLLTGKSDKSIMSTFGIPDDLARLKRFFIFGFFDGAVGHTWFQLLDKYLMVNKPDGMLTTIVEKVAWDILFYTPVWCVFFLVSMCLLRGEFRVGSILGSIKSEFKELVLLDAGFFLPNACIVYTFIPLMYRPKFYAFMSVIYTVILSLWAKKKGVSAD